MFQPQSFLIESPAHGQFTVAEYDRLQFEERAVVQAQSWFEARDEYPRLLYLPDGNHKSGATTLGSMDVMLFAELAAFKSRFCLSPSSPQSVD